MPADTTTPELAALAAVPGFDSMPSIDSDSSAALDAALLEATEGEGDSHDQPNDAPPAKLETPAVDAVVADAEMVAAVEVEKTKPAPDELDAVTVPPHTKPKTGEAFDAVKKIAREKITKLEATATTLAAEKKALEEKLAGVADGMTPELKAEMEELRTFRKRLDVESGPEFKSFDTRVGSNTETIYAKLLAVGVPQSNIDKIKELGGPDGVNWEPILEKLPSVTRRFVESKLVENEELAGMKKTAIETAKANVDEFLKTRANQTDTQRKTLQDRAEKQLTQWRTEMTWMKPKASDPKATPEQKAEMEAFNAVIKESEEYMKDAIGDDSPEMRATLALAGPELLKVKHEYGTYKKSTEAQIASLTADLTSANALLEKVKKGSTSRLRESPAGGAPAKMKSLLEESAGDALDRYAREATEASN